ncbi:MAG: integrase family protein [Acidimicrobiales bacterium]|nr:integrase family protein [Acidimicrobiales bacterium]
MATITEREPGVWLARTFLAPTAPGERGRQVGKTFRGSKKAVRARIAEWEAELQGTAPATVGATVADLLVLWQEAKAFDWQPTTARDHRSRAGLITADLGSVRLVDLDPFRIDKWIAQMRRASVGEGAIRSRVSALRAALSWGISRRMLRSNPITEARPRVHSGRRSARPDPEQVVALLAAARAEGTRAALGLRLAAVAGARAAEVVALRWDDLTGERLVIGRQRHSDSGKVLLREHTKAGGSRTVVLDPATVQAIHGWKAEVEEIVGQPTTWMLSEPGDADPPSRGGCTTRSCGLQQRRASAPGGTASCSTTSATGRPAPPCATATTR